MWCDPDTQLLGVCPKGMKLESQRDNGITTSSQDVEATQVFQVGAWIKEASGMSQAEAVSLSPSLSPTSTSRRTPRVCRSWIKKETVEWEGELLRGKQSMK